MNAHETLTDTAAKSALALGAAPLDEAVARKAILCLKDYLSACLGAVDGSPSMAALRYAAASGGHPEAMVWGAGRLDAQTAALCNGILGHTLIRDDMHVGSGTHPGVVILPAMLALGQRERLSGAQLLRGIVAGYQMMGALGIAVRTGMKNRHFRPLGICGAFGAAAGAIAACQPSAQAAVSALGLAANSGMGLNQWPWSGGEEISFHAGMAARNGLTAFDLARAGLRASTDILEGRDGLFAAHGSGSGANEVFIQNLGLSPHILNVTHKPVPGCNYVQTAVAAAQQLHARLGPAGSAGVRRIAIHTFEAARRYPGCDYAGPFDSVSQSKMSLQYGVAAALLFGAMEEDAYLEFNHAELNRLLSVCEIRTDPALEGHAPRRQPARVEIDRDGGQTLAVALEDVPWLSPSEVQARFERDARRHYGNAVAQRIDAALEDLMPMKDTSALFDLLERPRPHLAPTEGARP